MKKHSERPEAATQKVQKTVMIPQRRRVSEIVFVATHSFSLKRICDAVAEQNTDLGGQSAQQLKIAAMPFDERKTFAATKEDLEQNTADLPVVMQRQVPVIQKAQRTVDVALLQYVDATVDVPVAKQHEDCMTKHNEIEMDKKLRSAQPRTESNKQIVFDSGGPSDLRFEVRCKQGSRVVRCALCDVGHISEDGCSQTKLTFVFWRFLRAIPQERAEQRTVERNVDVPVPGACPRLNRRTDRRCACATVDSERDRCSGDVGPT